MGKREIGRLGRRAADGKWGKMGAAFAGLLAMAACGGSPDLDPPSSPVALEDRDLPTCGVTSSIVLDTVASGLQVPWGATTLPDGSVLVTERPGRILRIEEAGRPPEEWGRVPVYAEDEVGLLGIDHRPTSDGGWDVFVVRTNYSEGVGWMPGPIRGALRRLVRAFDPERGHVVTTEVLRFPTAPNGAPGAPSIFIGPLPSGRIHGGGTVRVGPDGLVYVTSGEAGVPAAAQGPGTRGKLLRYTPEGQPAGALEGSPVLARGIRSAQGMDWAPGTDRLYLIDHGPSGLEIEGGRVGNDELNRVAPGDNLGWPHVAGLSEGGGFTSPLAEWTRAVAPAGMSFYRGDDEAWRGDLFLTSLARGALIRVELDEGGAASCQEFIPLGLGRLRLVTPGSDGSLWVGTSNRDGRGSARSQDDVIVRVRRVDSAID